MSDELKKILYIEDVKSIAMVAVMVLEDLGGFEVRHFLSGQEAIDALPDFAPQLVLLDVMMPGRKPCGESGNCPKAATFRRSS
mgnify:CR=1 FL=1